MECGNDNKPIVQGWRNTGRDKPTIIKKSDQMFIKNCRFAFDDEKFIGPFPVIDRKKEHEFMLRKESNGMIYSRYYKDTKKIKSESIENKNQIMKR